MTAVILREAEGDLEAAFDYYERQRSGLGAELVVEFRRAVDCILEHPNAWQALDNIYRRCGFHRFPYGVIYRVGSAVSRITIIAIMQLSQRPDWWRKRQ